MKAVQLTGSWFFLISAFISLFASTINALSFSTLPCADGGFPHDCSPLLDRAHTPHTESTALTSESTHSYAFLAS
jgi:hypothetical protein